jgi:hypothetical protein
MLSYIIIDELSPTYPYVLPSVLRLDNLTIMSTSYAYDVSVSTFNSTNLNINNDLAIYTFLAGFSIKIQNNIY